MDIFNRFVAAGRGLRFAAREVVSTPTAELALEQVRLLLVILPADVLRRLRSRLDVEIADCAAHHDAALRNDLNRVAVALAWVAENANSSEIAAQAADLEHWLVTTLKGL